MDKDGSDGVDTVLGRFTLEADGGSLSGLWPLFCAKDPMDHPIPPSTSSSSKWLIPLLVVALVAAAVLVVLAMRSDNAPSNSNTL